jgi:hypothetical protein
MKPDDLINKLIRAVELYAAAGDEQNTRSQYFRLSRKARKIIMNEVIPALQEAHDGRS